MSPWKLLITGLALPCCASLALAGGAPGATPSAASRILLASDRDGTARMYSVGQDGSGLAPLFAPGGPQLGAAAVSPDGGTIAYIGGRDAPDSGPLYVSRADGSGLRLVKKWTDEVAFSPTGSLLAFRGTRGIWVVRPDGRGLRRLTSEHDSAFDWSPNGKALVFMRVLRGHDDRYAVIVQPLRGKRRVLVRTGPNSEAGASEYGPAWSPNGRWIGYVNREDKERYNGVTLVRPNGKERHRVVLGQSEEDSFQWSPDGRWLAYQDGTELDYILPSGAWHKISSRAFGSVAWSPDGKKLAFVVFVGDGAGLHEDLAVARGNGEGLRRLHVAVSDLQESSPLWSPDSMRVAFVGSNGGDPSQIWVVGGDGSGLRRLTHEGRNDVVAWTSAVPVLPAAPPLPPTEGIIEPDTVGTTTAVAALSADGPRVAFAVRSTPTDCVRVMVWTPSEGSLVRLGHLPAPCWALETRVTPLALAGTRAAWVSSVAESGESTCSFTLESATLADPAARILGGAGGASTASCKSGDIDHVRGDGDVLVFNNEPSSPSSLIRVGAETTTLRKDALAAPVDSVSGGLIAIRKPGAVTVLDHDGRLVRTFPFSPADVYSARLDDGHLVVARSDTLESYDVASGALEASQPLPAGYQLSDADGGIAVVRRTASVILIRLADGRSVTLTPGAGPILADLESPGLYYSYVTTDGVGRVVFIPRAELAKQLAGMS